MAVGEFGRDDRVLAELGAQTGERAVGGVEITARLLGKQTQLLAGGGAGSARSSISTTPAASWSDSKRRRTRSRICAASRVGTAGRSGSLSQLP